MKKKECVCMRMHQPEVWKKMTFEKKKIYGSGVNHFNVGYRALTCRKDEGSWFPVKWYAKGHTHSR